MNWTSLDLGLATMRPFPMTDDAASAHRPTTPPDAGVIAQFAEQALASIPETLRRHVQGVAISVEEMPDDETLDALGIETAWDLTGLYHGTPFGQRGSGDVATMPDMIVLYRQPILLEWIETGEDLARLVSNVVIHEVAHHFGFSDADIERLETPD